MVVRGWLINGVIIYIASLVSSEVQELYHQENAAVPPSICSGDLSFTKGYRCVDYNVSNFVIIWHVVSSVFIHKILTCFLILYFFLLSQNNSFVWEKKYLIKISIIPDVR